MPALPTAPFLFVVCQVGAEPALKKEVARTHPELRFAYSRPGFVTFKCVDAEQKLDSSFELISVFARAYGLSFGKASPNCLGGLIELAESLRPSDPGAKLRLHLWERDQYFPGEEPLGFERGKWAHAASDALFGNKAARTLFHSESLACAGDLVFDVVAVEPTEWWYGFHVHSGAHSPAAGGSFVIDLPAEAPSRAYIKIEEALRWSGAPVQDGDIAVEIGSAPGGASFALLKRGLRVVGIDPGEMDPRVLNFKNSKGKAFKHIQTPVAQVLREDLPTSVQWLLLDMNVEPRISLYAVDRLGTRMRDSLLGMFLTVKLNQWKIADEIPDMLEHVRAMGMTHVRATQLASNRQEIMIHGLTRKGVARHSACT